MATDETTKAEVASIDLDSSPFEAQAIEGMPFGKDSEEARAIREVMSGPIAGARPRSDAPEAGRPCSAG